MPSQSSFPFINSPAPSAFSKPGFTLIEALVSIGVFVLLASGGTVAYVSWTQTSHHDTAVTIIVNLIEKAERNALSSVDGTDWILEQTSANSVTLRGATSATTETLSLANGTIMDWNLKTSYTFSTPRGLTDGPGTITITTAGKTTDISIRANGTVDITPTTP